MVLILNFKTYEESSGSKSIECARAAYEFSKNSSHTVIICAAITDIKELLGLFPQSDRFKIWSQHVDPNDGDKNTGFVTVKMLKEIGVSGSLVNHAEHKVNEISKYTTIDDNIDLCFCISDFFELTLALTKNPDFVPKYIAYEPPSLIGGNVSVSTASPYEIENIVEKFSNYEVLVGAGVKTKTDVQTALKIGAQGILISSGFVLAEDKFKFLQELTSL